MIPAAALNQHIAILGKTGSGKSYTAKGIVEGLLARQQQVCIVDPTGAWWGLRLAADGRKRGFDVVILGGSHADIPLAERSGSAVARLVTEQGASVVLDTSGMTVGEYTRWFIDFAGTLYTTIHSPLHLVIDEAHYFMPQGGGGRVDVDAGRMLHAGNRLMSGGRSKGVRGMLITQRPAKLHKDSLTCADTLIAMRVMAPQDRVAIKEWIDGAGDARQGRNVLDSLAGLARGEGWVWYPEGGYLERVRFPAIKTYDSSATPTHGAKAGPQVSEIKLDDVRAALADAVREAEANDPKLLRARIAELEKQARQAKPDPAAVEVAIAKERSRADRELELREQEWTAALKAWHVRMEQIIAIASENGVAVPAPAQIEPKPVTSSIREKRIEPRFTPSAATSELAGPERQALAALAWFAAIGVDEPEKAQLCFRLGWRPTSGHIKNVLGRLRSLGLVNGLRLTDAGRATADKPESVGSLADYHAQIRSFLDGPQRLVFDLLLRGEMSREEICDALGWSPASGHIKNVIGALRTFGVVEKRAWKQSRLAFPEGLK